MRTIDKTFALQRTITTRLDVTLDLDDVDTLRRAQLTLHRWAEGECGDDNSCITRDETTGKPYREYAGVSGRNRMVPIPDRETGALRRVRDVCARYGLMYYHQTDPRGCALYVSTQERGMTDSNYNSTGVACVA